jgi:hypothetical protein
MSSGQRPTTTVYGVVMTVPWHEIALTTADELQRMIEGVDFDDSYETSWLARQAEMLEHLARAAAEQTSCPPGRYTGLINFATKVQDQVHALQQGTTD